MNLEPFALERYFARHEFAARHLLGSSDPEAMAVEDLLALEPGSEEGLRHVWLGYTESLGDPALRSTIASHYPGLGPHQILTFTGAEEPIFAFMHAALAPGDHLIVHRPAYQSHHAVAASRGIQVSDWWGDPTRGWPLNPGVRRGPIRPNTKAILLCPPHNPTGFLFDRPTLDAVLALAQDRGLWIFSDEVYRGTEADPAHRLPPLASLYPRALSLDCLSKSYGLAGLRLGWVATQDPELFRRLATFKDYLSICGSAPSEFLGHLALRHGEALRARTRARLQANLDLLEPFFHRQAAWFQWQRPRAGTTTFPRLLRGRAMDLCERLLADTGIMLVPGDFFAMEGEFLRFGHGRASLPHVLPLLEAWLEAQAG